MSSALLTLRSRLVLLHKPVKVKGKPQHLRMEVYLCTINFRQPQPALRDPPLEPLVSPDLEMKYQLGTIEHSLSFTLFLLQQPNSLEGFSKKLRNLLGFETFLEDPQVFHAYGR